MEEEKSILEVFGEKSQDADMLDPSSLEEWKWMDRKQDADILYRALTKGGDERFIHKTLGLYPSPHNREWMANMVRGAIEQNPSFADTLSQEEGMEKLAPRKSFLMRMLGF